MDEVGPFLDQVIPLLRDEVFALQNGDAGPRKALWSRQNPVTLFGAEASASGWEEVEPFSIDSLRVSPTANPARTRCSAPASVAISDMWQPSSGPSLAHVARPRRPSRFESRRSSGAKRAIGGSSIGTATPSTPRRVKPWVVDASGERCRHRGIGSAVE
jgi:hypothetical protein